MTNTAAAAVRVANSISTGYGGLCLRFVRICYDIPAKYASARSAWDNAKKKHKGSSLAGVPVGVPLFLDSRASRYGHVAVYLGNGYMRTTNSSTGRIHTQAVSAWVAAGWTVLGWTEDLNGVAIPGIAVTSSETYQPRTLPTLRRGASGSWVKMWQAVIGAKVDGDFGPDTLAKTKAWQNNHGLKGDGVVGLLSWSRAALGVKPGTSSARVRVWQAIIGLTGADIDGIMGRKSVARTKAVQRWLGVTPDGAVGPLTRGAYVARMN